MADNGAKSLEDRLKLAFDCSALCSLDQKKTELRICKSEGMGAFLMEDYVSARQLFVNGISKTNSAEEREWLYKMVVGCSKELLKVADGKNDDAGMLNEFEKVCRAYESLIKHFEKPEHYLDYLGFIGKEMGEDYGKKMYEEAIRIGEIALARFPEEHRLYAEMRELYKFTENKARARQCLNTVVRLKFDDADYLLKEYGLELWSSDETDIGLPFNIILEYRGGAINKNPQALQKYGRFITENPRLRTNSKLAVNMLYNAYRMNPAIPELKDDLVAAFDNASEFFKEKDDNEGYRAFVRKYNPVLQLKKGISGEKTRKALTAGNHDSLITIITKAGAIPTPRDIKSMFDSYVIGQDNATKIASVGVYNHLLKQKAAAEGVDLEKSNMLLLGPTGCGKTYIASIIPIILKEILKKDIPFIVYDASKITDEGIVGEKADMPLEMLYMAAGKDIELAQMGVIYLDELDKRRESGYSGADVGGQGAQQQLLKPVEGAIVNVRLGGAMGRGGMVQINTSNILFIGGGAFSKGTAGDSLTDSVGNRTGQKTMGFKMNSEKAEETTHLLNMVMPQDLVEYGFLPEFIARFPIRAPLYELSKEDLKEILTKPKKAVIPHYEKLLKYAGINLSVTEDGKDAIVESAIGLKQGARSLRAVCETIFAEAEFELSERNITTMKELVVDREFVNKYWKKRQ